MLLSNVIGRGAWALAVALGAVVTWVQPPQAAGQDAARRTSDSASKTQEVGSKANAEKGKWVPLFERHASEYAIHVGEDRTGEAKRLTEPVLRWWQPVRGGDDGALYVWARDGRPVAVVTFFTFKLANGDRYITHERHSMTALRVEATWRGETVWRTSRPGLSFKPVPDAPAPAETAPARLRQMQAMVRQFSANTVDSKNSTWPLRPLVKPLYRYDSKDDGALFGLVQGTDPEAFVVLEVRGKGNDAHWEFAVARFTDLEIHVRLNDREIFTAPHSLGGMNEIYQTLTVMNKPSDSPADFE